MVGGAPASERLFEVLTGQTPFLATSLSRCGQKCLSQHGRKPMADGRVTPPSIQRVQTAGPDAGSTMNESALCFEWAIIRAQGRYRNKDLRRLHFGRPDTQASRPQSPQPRARARAGGCVSGEHLFDFTSNGVCFHFSVVDAASVGREAADSPPVLRWLHHLTSKAHGPGHVQCLVTNGRSLMGDRIHLVCPVHPVVAGTPADLAVPRSQKLVHLWRDRGDLPTRTPVRGPGFAAVADSDPAITCHVPA